MKAQRRDRNEGEIRKRAEALGFLWLENTASTKGRPDAALLRFGGTHWCEVKEKGEPFTKAQMEEFPRIVAKGVPIYVLEEPDDVDRMAAGTLQAWAPEMATATVSRGRGSRAKKPRQRKPGYDRPTASEDFCVEVFCGRSRLPGLTKCAMHEGRGKK